MIVLLLFPHIIGLGWSQGLSSVRWAIRQLLSHKHQ